MTKEDVAMSSTALFSVVCTVLAFLIALLSFSLYFQHQNYDLAMRRALESSAPDYASVITYLRAWDFAVVKVSSIFLSFLLMFTGALYVLRVGQESYAVSAETQHIKGSLATSSPGLVMVTLGVVLAIATIYSRTLVEYTPPASVLPGQMQTKPATSEPESPRPPSKNAVPENGGVK